MSLYNGIIMLACSNFDIYVALNCTWYDLLNGWHIADMNLSIIPMLSIQSFEKVLQ